MIATLSEGGAALGAQFPASVSMGGRDKPGHDDP
jgi:hypothetical protein